MNVESHLESRRRAVLLSPSAHREMMVSKGAYEVCQANVLASLPPWRKHVCFSDELGMVVPVEMYCRL